MIIIKRNGTTLKVSKNAYEIYFKKIGFKEVNEKKNNEKVNVEKQVKQEKTLENLKEVGDK